MAWPLPLPRGITPDNGGTTWKTTERQRGTRDMSRAGPSGADELLTLDEVAALLKLPKSWIYERTRRKLIPHVKLGKYLRFSACRALQVGPRRRRRRAGSGAGEAGPLGACAAVAARAEGSSAPAAAAIPPAMTAVFLCG